MAKIADVVKLKSGYANFVELKSDFEEIQKNAGQIAMYRPTKAALWYPENTDSIAPYKKK